VYNKYLTITQMRLAIIIRWYTAQTRRTD